MLKCRFAAAAIVAVALPLAAHAQQKEIKIGVIYDLTGPLAGGGSELQYIGAKIMLDQYAKTGVEGYKVEAVYADAQVAGDPVLKAFRQQVDVAVPMPNLPEMSMAWSPATTAMNTVVKKTATPKQALDEAQKEVLERIANLLKK